MEKSLYDMGGSYYTYVEASITLVELFPRSRSYASCAPVDKPIIDDICELGETLRIIREGAVIFDEVRVYR